MAEMIKKLNRFEFTEREVKDERKNKENQGIY